MPPQPQVITVPLLSDAKLWAKPAAIVVTPAMPLGTLHCPKSAAKISGGRAMQPQATTVPSLFRARL
jgi:hypothetical protein